MFSGLMANTIDHLAWQLMLPRIQWIGVTVNDSTILLAMLWVLLTNTT
jgi:hypothetical protein|tara:strand:- start:1043 stop:1186 length:144 start_codon:yes stop_codon:yes gene_type:complete